MILGIFNILPRNGVFSPVSINTKESKIIGNEEIGQEKHIEGSGRCP